MDSRNRAVVVLFRGDPRRDERQKRLPRQFLSTLHVAILKTIGEVAGVDVLIARDVGPDFRLGDRSWQLDSLAERIAAAIAYGFSRGYARVLLLAGDIVDVRRDAIERAFQALGDCAAENTPTGDNPEEGLPNQRCRPCRLAVGSAEAAGQGSTDPKPSATSAAGRAGRRAAIGFSGDGGFYAAGFSQSPDLDWARLLHDRPNAGAALTEALRADGFVVEELPPVDDIDTRADAERLVRPRRASRALLRLIAKLTSILQRLVVVTELPQAPVGVALAFCSRLRGPPRSRRAL